MVFKIIILNNSEDYLHTLDNNQCFVKETCAVNGIKELNLTYTFKDLNTAKDLFRLGNKILLIYKNYSCLYVINSNVETNVYDTNNITVNAEEVLVELNYAPLTTQTEVTKANGFTIRTINNRQSILIDYNSLNYWFGDYFHIGTINETTMKSQKYINFNGSMNLMKLLRSIEDQTGNRFIARYEVNNTFGFNKIIRYLDFLNPSKLSDWNYTLTYDYIDTDLINSGIFTHDNNRTSDYDEDIESEDDLLLYDNHDNLLKYDPNLTSDSVLSFTNLDGEVITVNDKPLSWTLQKLGYKPGEPFTIQLISKGYSLGLYLCRKDSFIKTRDETIDSHAGTFNYYYVTNNIAPMVEFDKGPLPFGAKLKIEKPDGTVLINTSVNNVLFNVNNEILTFNDSLEDIVFEYDESNTYSATAPMFSTGEGLNYDNINTLIKEWNTLSIEKGVWIPRTIIRTEVEATTLEKAIESLGTWSLGSNYWNRPKNPKDNVKPNSNNTFEFYRATSYYRAPYEKIHNDFHISLEEHINQYDSVIRRTDERNIVTTADPKQLPVDVKGLDNIILVYNKLADELKKVKDPVFNIRTKVKFIKGTTVNNYEPYQLVYIKQPGNNELVLGQITSIEKNYNDPSENTVTIENNLINNHHTQEETVILAENIEIIYPKNYKYRVRLQNLDYDKESGSEQYPSNELLTFQIKSRGNRTNSNYETIISKRTNQNGYATVTLTELPPGNYYLTITYGGNTYYQPTKETVDVNVSGKLDLAKPVKTAKKYPKDYTKKPHIQMYDGKIIHLDRYLYKYYNKYYYKNGVSPDEKYIMAIGRRSASHDPRVTYKKFYKTVFHNRCPRCGARGELRWNIFWTGSEHITTGHNPVVNNRRKSGSVEGEITCLSCDADYSVFGIEKVNNPAHLNIKEGTKVSSKAEAYKLKKGKMLYGYTAVPIKRRVLTKMIHGESIVPNISPKVRKRARYEVGGSNGIAACKKLTKFVSERIRYKTYANFKRKPVTVLRKRYGNCCDQARLLATLIDAAGLMDQVKVQYVHVGRGKAGHVFLKLTTLKSGKWRYVDPVLGNFKRSWSHYWTNNGTVGSNLKKITDYPTLPF